MDLWGRLARIFSPPREPVSAGSAGAAPVSPQYSARSAMSTIARFPHVVVCVRAKSGDLAGLPLVAVKREGSVEHILDDHPTLRLLRRPAPRMSGLRLRRQLYADFSLTGNAYMERPGSHLLLRMHPGLARPVADPTTHQQIGWSYGDRLLPLDAVHGIHDISWADTVEMLLGESVIRALHDDLTTEMQAREMTSKQSARGRPELLLRPKNEDAQVGDVSIRRLEQRWEDFTRSGKGAFFIDSFFEAQPLNLTPREMEFTQLRHDNRDTTMAVFEVPPARYGLATANYGTQKQQMRTYWEALLKGMGALFEDEWSLMTGDDSVSIRHDSTNIEALQLNYTERQLRAERWITVFGATASAAAAYEGFHNAPVGNATGRSTRPPAKEADEPQPRAALAEHIAGYLRDAADRYQARILAADGAVELVRARDEEAVRALVELERAGVPGAVALDWAADIAEVTDESAAGIAAEAWADGVTRVGIESMAAFGAERAAQIAAAITADAADHRRAA